MNTGLILKKMKRIRWILILMISLSIIGTFLAGYYNLIPEKTYTAQDFGIVLAAYAADFNGNGIEDHMDLMLGARKDALNHPTYSDLYYEGGYPPEDVGVCTDVIWRAFREAGFSLKDMVDQDIILQRDAYKHIKYRDPNIDFRHVRTLRVFFDRYAQALTLDIDDLDQWLPGDIVIFGKDEHIGIVSDIRNAMGHTYIIHNSDQPVREEDYFKRRVVTGHYRFNADLIPPEILVAWQDPNDRP